MPRSKSSDVSLSSVVEGLKKLGLSSMADQLLEMDQSNELYKKTTLEVLNDLIETQSIDRINTTVSRCKKQAGLYFPQADIRDIIYWPERHINASLIDQLSTNQYIENSRNVLIKSATGCGKTFLACALGNCACEAQYSVRYFTMDDLFERLQTAQNKGKYVKELKKIGNTNLIIIDDFLLTSVNQEQAQFLYRLLNSKPYKNKPRSFIICSQLMEEEMYTRLCALSPALSDAVTNRLTARAYDLEIQGKSMREADIPAELKRMKEDESDEK